MTCSAFRITAGHSTSTEFLSFQDDLTAQFERKSLTQLRCRSWVSTPAPSSHTTRQARSQSARLLPVRWLCGAHRKDNVVSLSRIIDGEDAQQDDRADQPGGQRRGH